VWSRQDHGQVEQDAKLFVMYCVRQSRQHERPPFALRTLCMCSSWCVEKHSGCLRMWSRKVGPGAAAPDQLELL
jgi:hypothetical protein